MKNQNEIRELLENSLSGIDRCKIESLTKAILNLMPFRKLERVENYLEIKTNEVRNEEDVTDDYINGFNNGIKNVVKGIASILSENEKAE